MNEIFSSNIGGCYTLADVEKKIGIKVPESMIQWDGWFGPVVAYGDVQKLLNS
jgi:hypothetical protein